MKYTFYNHDDGTPSSWRVRSEHFSMNLYSSDLLKGGVTTNIGGYTSRMSNNGTFLGSGIGIGGSTTYYGSGGQVQDYITSY